MLLKIAYQEGSQGQVDERVRDVQLSSQDIEGGEVDIGGDRREESCRRYTGNDKGLFAPAKRGVWRLNYGCFRVLLRLVASAPLLRSTRHPCCQRASERWTESILKTAK